MVENRTGGAKSREVYEAPAAVVLHTAHRELQAFVIPRDLERITTELGVKYADLVYKGLWYTQTRQAIDALVRHVQERVTGTIRMRFFKGETRVIGRQSPFGEVNRTKADP
jgi:argininosuccinate synthase